MRSLTAPLYVLHVYRRSFISPFINCILCFMWLGFSHLFSYKCMYAGWVNFTSLLFMNVYRIYILIVWFIFRLFIDELTKRGRSIWWVNICMFILFPRLYKKGEKNLVSLCMFIFIIGICIYVFIYAEGEKHSLLMHVYVEHSLNIFIFIAMHELRGSFYEA